MATSFFHLLSLPHILPTPLSSFLPSVWWNPNLLFLWLTLMSCLSPLLAFLSIFRFHIFPHFSLHADDGWQIFLETKFFNQILLLLQTLTIFWDRSLTLVVFVSLNHQAVGHKERSPLYKECKQPWLTKADLGLDSNINNPRLWEYTNQWVNFYVVVWFASNSNHIRVLSRQEH